MFKSIAYEERIAQVAAYVLHKGGGSLELLKLMKLMYLVERESLALFGEPITGDTAFAFKDGPVLSTTYNRAKAKEPQPFPWGELMLPRDGNDIALRDKIIAPATPKLSRANRRAIDAVWERFGSMTGSELRRWTHNNCPEYDDPVARGELRLPIEAKRLLMAVGYDEPSAVARLEELSNQAELRARLPSHA